MPVLFRTLILTLVITFLSGAGAAWSAGAKFGFVNLKKAIAKTNEFERKKSAFDAQFKKEQATIAKQEKELKKSLDELNKQGFVLSPELKKKKEADFMVRKKQLERYVQDKNEEFGRKEQEVTMQVTKRMMNIIQTVGKKNKFTLIIEKAATFYFDNAMDVTDEVIKAYNKNHK